MHKTIGVALFSLFASCSAVPEREFEIRAINNEGQSVPCLIVVDNERPRSEEDATFTDGTVTIQFTKEPMHLHVYPAPQRDDKPQIPEPNYRGTYLDDGRELRGDDPPIHLFILNRRS